MKAADELGVKLVYDGPTTPSGEEQNKYIDTWIRHGVDAICIAPNQPKRIQSFVAKAQAAGIKVLAALLRTIALTPTSDIGEADTASGGGNGCGDLEPIADSVDLRDGWSQRGSTCCTSGRNSGSHDRSQNRSARRIRNDRTRTPGKPEPTVPAKNTTGQAPPQQGDSTCLC